MSQSPSLRGSGRFAAKALATAWRADMSQSPSLRGSGRFGELLRPGAGRSSSLNPLHCGAVVASWLSQRSPYGGRSVSIPFIAGQWSLHAGEGLFLSVGVMSQSPSLRGSGRFMKALQYDL